MVIFMFRYAMFSKYAFVSLLLLIKSTTFLKKQPNYTIIIKIIFKICKKREIKQWKSRVDLLGRSDVLSVYPDTFL